MIYYLLALLIIWNVVVLFFMRSISTRHSITYGEFQRKFYLLKHF